MANDKKFIVKRGLSAPNVDFANGGGTISATYLNTSNTLSITGGTGQLFSITDSMSGTIFSVNDISGIPSIEVADTGAVKLAETFGAVGVGTNPLSNYKFHVSGNTLFGNSVTFNSTLIANGSVGTAGFVLTSNGTGLYWSAANSSIASVATANNSTYAYGKQEFQLSVANTVALQGATWQAPLAIGGTTPNSGAFTTITASANVNFDSGTFFVDGTSNRAGVGTLVPSVKFDVVGLDGDGLQYRTSTRTIGIGSVGGLNALYGGSGTELIFHIGSERMRLTSAGRLGIGTQTPQTPFVVSNAGAGGLEFDGSTGLIQSYNRSTSAYQTMLFDASATVFRPSGTERMRVTATGLGISNTTPGQTLQVDGSVGIKNGLVANGSFGTAGFVLTSNGSVVYWANAASISGTVLNANNSTHAYGKQEFQLSVANSAALQSATWQAPLAIGSATPNSGAFTSITASANVNFDSGVFFTDASTNRVGVGTATPLTRFHVGTKIADDNVYVYDGNTAMVVHQQPTSTTVLNDPKETLLLARQGTGGQAYGAAASFDLSRYENNGVNSRTRLDFKLAHGSFLSNPTIAMTMLSSGNIGLGGNTTPGQTLQVDGSIGIRNGIVANGSFGTSGFVLTSNGSVAYWANAASISGTVLTANNSTHLNGKQESQLSVAIAANSAQLLGRTWAAAGDIVANTVTIGIPNVGGTTPIKTFSIVTNNQSAINTTYEIGRISRDSVNWSTQALEVTIYNLYYRGGMSRWGISFNQIDSGTVELIDRSGTFPHKLYLGTEVIVSGTIGYRPILVDLPQYTIANIEMKYKYNEVTTISGSSQIQFTGTYTTNASATGYASASTSQFANNSLYLGGFNSAYYTNADNIGTGTLAEARLPFRMNQNVRTTDNVTFANLTITGSVIVTGNVSTFSSNNVMISDNMIYLNANSTVTNPDIGLAANYNDGTYRHTGIFRDATDGTWKVFDRYTPEPDASPYIDTGHATFRIADFQANSVHINALYGNSKEIFNTSDSYLRINQSNGFTNGIWMSGSNLGGGAGTIHMGSNGDPASARVRIIGGTYNGSTVITLNGTNGNITASNLISAADLSLSGNMTSATATVNSGSVYRSDWTTRFQSSSDFVDGTLVTTDIPATATNGDSFIIEITGKSYSSSVPPFKIIAQGYLYTDTIIAFSGINYGGAFSSYIKAFQDGGVLKFWWPRVSYWNSFNVNVMSMDAATNGTISRNRVTAIGNATEPTGTKKVQINLATTWNSTNFTPSNYLPLSGGTMTGAITFAGGQTWPTFNQSTTGSAATLTTARNINGTSFNGSADITTANWGTSRTLTIGSTGKSVNGSGNVSWTHAELGAVRNLGVVAVQAVVGSNQTCTTAEFVTWLTGIGAFAQTASVMKCTWDYAGNNDLSDTGFGTLDLAGCIIETFTDGGQYIIRVTSPSTGSGSGGIHEYINHGGSYSPGWRRVYTSALNGNISGSSGSTTGNAATATALQTARTINGVSFDGTANITVADNTKLPLAGGTLTGALTTASAAGLGNGNARSLITGYSGGNYGQTGYGIAFTTTSDLHNYAINDAVSLWEAVDGLRVKAAAGGTVGSAITWTTVLDARRTMSAMTFKGNTVLDSANYGTYAAAAGHTHTIAGITDAARWWNNFGDNHSTRSSFDATSPSIGFGWRYVQGSTNGPGVNSATQYYSLYTGLGNDYGSTGAGSYGMQIAFPRNVSNPYIAIRYNENNSFGAWQKISAGYADLAGSVTDGVYTTGNQTIGGTKTFSSTISGSINGNAATVTNGVYTSTDQTIGGTKTFSSTIVGSINGNAATATTADQIDGIGFRNTGSNSATNADTIESNGITYYSAGVSNFSGNATDGALYSQAYSANWQHQIAGDYRSGQIALRGKNNGTWQSWRTVIDSGNYNSYAPTLTGTGANGTWGINITGSAGSATTASSSPLLSALNNYVWTQSTLPNSYNLGIQSSFVGPNTGEGSWQNYGSVMTMRTYSGGGGSLQMYVPYSPGNGGTGLQVRFGNYEVSSGNAWTSWKTLLASDNYNSYAPTLTGTGANGTWGINITGNAATVGSLSVHTGTNNEANKIVRTDANGYIIAGYINSANGNEANNSNPPRVWGTNGSDSYLRTYLTSALSVGYATSAGTATDSSKLPLAGGTMTGIIVGKTPASGQTDVNSANDTGSFSVRGNTSTIAAMSFHRTDAYAINMGLGTDNVFRIGGWSASSNCFQMDGSGNLTMLNNVTAYSDLRLKKDIVKIDNALEKVGKLNGYTYTRTDTDTRQMGVIAQEVMEVIPEVVLGSEETNYSVAYGNMVGLLIEAIKELKSTVDEQQRVIDTLTSKKI